MSVTWSKNAHAVAVRFAAIPSGAAIQKWVSDITHPNANSHGRTEHPRDPAARRGTSNVLQHIDAIPAANSGSTSFAPGPS